MPMVETELCLFEMKLELVFAHPVKLSQSMFCVTPKRFDAIDMPATARELIVAMIDSKVLVNAESHQAVIARPAIGVDDAVGIELAPDNGLQRGLGGIGDDLGVDTVTALEQTKDDGFSCGTATTLATNAPSSEVGLVSFDLSSERREQLAQSWARRARMRW